MTDFLANPELGQYFESMRTLGRSFSQACDTNLDGCLCLNSHNANYKHGCEHVGGGTDKVWGGDADKVAVKC